MYIAILCLKVEQKQVCEPLLYIYLAVKNIWLLFLIVNWWLTPAYIATVFTWLNAAPLIVAALK